MHEKQKKNAPDQEVRIRKFVYLAVMATKVFNIQRLEKNVETGNCHLKVSWSKEFQSTAYSEQ